MSEPEAQRVDEALASLRGAAERQLGTARPPAVDGDPGALVRFSEDLPDELADEERHSLSARAEKLQPWLQGPFLLGGDLVVGGTWRSDRRWARLDGALGDGISGRRVLDVGCNAGYDSFMFRLRGAEHVLGCEPFEFIEQARFLESIYRTGAEFEPIGWQELSPERHGLFDIVHCHGVLYHELNPMGLLARLAEMTVPGGLLLLGSMMLADPRLSEHMRFVPTSYYGDDTWWWVPGRLALRWMIETSGFDVEAEFGEVPGPQGEFRTVNGYFKGRRSERLPAASSPPGPR
jgi:tRNA (mo5U34)-methyltransferase